MIFPRSYIARLEARLAQLEEKLKTLEMADARTAGILATGVRQLTRIADAQERAHPRPQIPSRQVVRFGAPVKE